LEPNIIMQFDNAEFIRSMVRAGLGASFLPPWVVDRDLKEQRLTRINHTGPLLYSRIALVRRKSSFVPHPVQAFISVARSLEPKHLRLLTTTAPNRSERKPRTTIPGNTGA
jgi:DNA-binding transcriptional LysR family regulator